MSKLRLDRRGRAKRTKFPVTVRFGCRWILDRQLAVEYVPSDARLEEAAEIYLVANGDGSRE